MTTYLAYWDSFSGLVPCKVVGIETSPDPDWHDAFGHNYCVIARLTADRGPYLRGERIAQSPTHVWPRDCVRTKRGTYGQTRIVTRYDWRERCEPCAAKIMVRINGYWRDDGTFIGFDYKHQHWYETSPDVERNCLHHLGSAANPFAVIPPDAEVIPD